MKSKVRKSTILDQIQSQFIEECAKRNLEMDKKFAHYIIHLLARDGRIGLNWSRFNQCVAERFLQTTVQRYADPLDATMCNLKMKYYFRNCKELHLDGVKQKYELLFEQKLQQLVDSIVQYPETSSKEQLDQLQHKMHIFIIASYNIGCPKNSVLLKQVQQSLNSVLGRSDLQNYVLKKKYHRLEYLQRLSATVSGILIYNNLDPTGEKEHIRDILADLNVAKATTKESFETAMKNINVYIKMGTDVMEDIIRVDVAVQRVHCHCPIEKVREINKFVALFNTYEYLLKQMVEIYEKTMYLISTASKRMSCVVSKINDILKFRTAIESELVFPHFKYLAEVWTTFTLYFNHLTELNKIKETLDTYVNEGIRAKFIDTIELIEEKRKIINKPNEPTFLQLLGYRNPSSSEGCTLQLLKYPFTEYCSLTMALTNGLLLSARVQKKLCENSELRFGFANIEYAKDAELHFEEFIVILSDAIYTSVDLIVLFNLEDEIMRLDLQSKKKCECILCDCKKASSQTQTEMVLQNDLSAPNRVNVTWNIWDFHRETIHLADIRKKQTRSQQTVHTFGKSSTQIQTYNARNHR